MATQTGSDILVPAWAVGSGQKAMAQNVLHSVQRWAENFPPEASGKEDVGDNYEDSILEFFLISPQET